MLIYLKLDWHAFAFNHPCLVVFMYILYQQQFPKDNDLHYICEVDIKPFGQNRALVHLARTF